MEEKEIILKFAGEKFQREGFNKISMDEIAFQLHISKKTIYKHFKSKDKLIESLIEKGCEYHLEKETAILSQNTNVVKKIAQMIQFNLNGFSRLSEKWLSDLQIHKPELWNKYTEFKNGEHFYCFRKIFIQGRKEKLLKDIPMDLVLNGIESIVKSVLHTDFLINSNLSFKQALNYSIDILISGILTEKGVKIYNKEKKLLKLYKF
jgi:AcrR family transcriptional regulator